MTYWLLFHTVLLYDTCWYDIPYHGILPVVLTYYAMTYYLRKHSMLRHTASCSKILCYDIVCCCTITRGIVHAVSWHVTSYAVTCYYAIASVCCCNIPWYDAFYDKCLLWHIMSLWHSYSLLLRPTISCDVTYVCRPFENIMFQSFIILSFFLVIFSFH
jgi:hypothetical protein